MHGIGTDPNSGAVAESLGLVDCPPGLARCVGSVVELSQAFRHPEPCTGPAERCACPWEILGRCESGCVADDLEVPILADRATRQLCSPSPAEPPAAYPPPLRIPTLEVCGDERYRCDGGRVVECGPPRLIAICNRGCAEEGETLDDATLNGPMAILLLCDR